MGQVSHSRGRDGAEPQQRPAVRHEETRVVIRRDNVNAVGELEATILQDQAWWSRRSPGPRDRSAEFSDRMAIGKKLRSDRGLGGRFTADFALEMIEGAECVRFLAKS